MANEKFRLLNKLELKRCPHCNISQPHLSKAWGPFETKEHSGRNCRFWCTYLCNSCGGLITAASTTSQDGFITEMYPKAIMIDESIPETAAAYLNQAIESIHAPAGAVVLSASAVDAMLKKKGYKEGSLYKRIEKAAEDHLITNEMAEWAHEVRLDANEQRHVDEDAPLPDSKDAERSIAFALALAEFLFVLPSRVEEGRKKINLE